MSARSAAPTCSDHCRPGHKQVPSLWNWGHLRPCRPKKPVDHRQAPQPSMTLRPILEPPTAFPSSPKGKCNTAVDVPLHNAQASMYLLHDPHASGKPLQNPAQTSQTYDSPTSNAHQCEHCNCAAPPTKPCGPATHLMQVERAPNKTVDPELMETWAITIPCGRDPWTCQTEQ